MAEAVLEIRDGLGITVVLVEHDMGMVMSLADRVTVLDFGRRIADGTPAEVQATPRSSAPTSAPATRSTRPRPPRPPHLPTPLRDSRDAA